MHLTKYIQKYKTPKCSVLGAIIIPDNGTLTYKNVHGVNTVTGIYILILHVLSLATSGVNGIDFSFCCWIHELGVCCNV